MLQIHTKITLAGRLNFNTIKISKKLAPVINKRFPLRTFFTKVKPSVSTAPAWKSAQVFLFSFLTGPHRNSNFRAGEKPKNVNIHFRIHFVVNSDRFLNFISLLKNIIFTYLFQAITSNCVVPPEDIVIVVYFSFSRPPTNPPTLVSSFKVLPRVMAGVARTY